MTTSGSSAQLARDDQELRSDVRVLGELLGQSLVRQEGAELLALVENVRKAVREGGGEDILANLSVEDSVQLVRAFSTYFYLANVAEQVHRARVLEEERELSGSWISRAVDRIIELRLGRPEPLDEAVNALYYLDDLFSMTIPNVLDNFARELTRVGVTISPTSRPLSFGTWIGGDRDGNPNITADITRQAITLQIGHFIRGMVACLDELRKALSVSTRIAGASPELEASVARDLEMIPEIEDRFKRLNVEEPYRMKATAIRHRLILTQRRHAAGAEHVPGRDYDHPCRFERWTYPCNYGCT